MSNERDASHVFLNPGEYFVGDDRQQIHTILGSCVSITLWHRERRIGAMSHFVLPSRTMGGGAQLDGRYGDEALLLMRRQLERRGIAITDCEAKIFGGADMASSGRLSEVFDVGRNNGHGARRLLETHNIPTVAESLFGTGHRRIKFDISSGTVWVNHVSPEPSK